MYVGSLFSGIGGIEHGFEKHGFKTKWFIEKRLTELMVNSKLTQSETEVLDMLTQDFMTPKKIAIRRQCSRQAVNKILKSLQKKGAYNIGLQMVDKLRVARQPSPSSVNQIRIHAQQFTIKILWKDHRYKLLLEKTSQQQIDGNTITFWPNSVDIYSNQSFYGNDIQQSLCRSFDYFDRLITSIEHKFNLILRKQQSQNFKMVRCHYAETNNEFSKDIDNKGDRFLKVFTKEDGKLWFLIDNSFNLHEAEAVHSKTGKEDMEKVKDVFNDIRDRESYLPSDTKEMLDKLAIVSSNILQYSEKANQNVEWLAQEIKTHGPAWLGMSKEAWGIRKEVKRLSGILSQKKLTEFQN